MFKRQAIAGLSIHGRRNRPRRDFLVVCYLVVDTSNWMGGRSVLIADAIESVDSESQKIRVRLTQEIEPVVDSADIELIETLPPRYDL